MQQWRLKHFMLAGVASGALLFGVMIWYGLPDDRKIPDTSSVVVVRSVEKPRSAVSNHDRVMPATEMSFPSTGSADPILDGMIDTDMGVRSDRNPADLHQKVRAEPRDAGWAPQAERALQAQLRDVPYLTGAPRVMCGSTICEIAGSVDGTASTYNANIAIRMLQSPDLLLSPDLRSVDPEKISVMFGSAKSNPSDSTFVRYVFRRTD